MLWFILTLTPLVIFQRLLHREIQAVFLLVTRNPQLTLGMFSILFFPGVLLHELSHYLMARFLRVGTKEVSLVPDLLPDGRLQMGYVETEPADIFRDSLIGLAPLISGSLFVAYVGIYQLQLLTLWDVVRNGQLDLFWLGLSLLPSTDDFYLWFYLTFAVAGTMLPSDADRRAWIPLALWVSILLGFAILGGAGNWMLENLAPMLDTFLYSISLLFGISAFLCAGLTAVFFIIHRLIAHLTGADVG